MKSWRPKTVVWLGLALSLANLPAVRVAADEPGKPSASATAEVFKAVGVTAAGQIGDGAVLYVPAGLRPEALPPSFSLVKTPALGGPVPAGWRVTPRFSASATRFRAHVPVDDKVDLYGGGEVAGPLRRNGTQIKLWNTDNYLYKKEGGCRLYQSHPWIMGVRADGTAFGVIFDSTWKAELDCRAGLTFTCEGPAFPVLILERISPQALLSALADWTGHMDLPPRWALGYQQCRYSYEPDTRVRQVAAEFRKRQLPCDVLWVDIDYMHGYRIFTFDPVKFAQPKKLNDDLHSQGFHSVWMIDPGVKVDPAYSVYQEGSARQAWMTTAAGQEYQGKVWPGPCVFPDFTIPAVRSWWSGLYRDYLAQGIDGVWNDMNEPSVFDGPDGTMPETNLHRGGGDLVAGPHRQYHNVYGLLMVRATREGVLAARPEKRPFVLTRSSFLGGQRYAATWTGDNMASDEHMRLSIPMSLTLGLSGQPFSGPDLGGYGNNATPELWARWISVGVFLPFCRGHSEKGANDKEPWMFGPAVEKTARMALERRYRLLPYLYTCFQTAAQTGLPVMRPVFFADATDASLRREEQAFLIGDDLLVQPAWAPDAARPKGLWHPLTLVAGDGADPHQAQLFIRGGAVLPVGRAVQHTGERSDDPLTLLVCFDKQGCAEGRLYEDAGDGFGYRAGDYRLAHYKATRRADGQVDVQVSATGHRPVPAERVVRVLVVEADGRQRAAGTPQGL
jgi:alpha-glucosidase